MVIGLVSIVDTIFTKRNAGALWMKYRYNANRNTNKIQLEFNTTTNKNTNEIQIAIQV